jgi:Cro/C1-type HTH DNA-binding domain
VSILTTYKAKKSNLKELLSKSNTKLDVLAANTNIPIEQLTTYLDSKVMSLNNAMSISKELNCTIEDLYVWKVSGE